MAQSAPGIIDPAENDDAYEAAIINQTFDGLLEFDANFNTMPSVAQSWQISRDQTRYTFQLKEDVHFHDGSLVTAEDFVYSFSRVFRKDPEQTQLAREYLGNIKGAQAYSEGKTERLEGLQAPGKFELQIELEKPYASFLAVLASEFARVVPQAYAEKVGNDYFGHHPIGCGPFKVAEWIENQHVILTAFDDYHNGRAYLDSLIYVLPEGSARDYAVNHFLTGDLSAAAVTMDRMEDVKQQPASVMLSRQELSLTYMSFNSQRPPFDNPDLRRAVASAVNTDALEPLLGCNRIRAKGILPPGLPGYYPEVKTLPYDPALARQLLAKAGYPDGKGLPPILHGSSNRSASEKRLYSAIAEQLAAVGIHMELEYTHWLDFNQKIRNSGYDCFSITWAADIPDPDSFLYPLFHSRGSTNFSQYANSEVDKLLDQGREGSGNTARFESYRTAERTILTEASIIPMYHIVTTIAIQGNVKNFQVTSMGEGNLPLHQVWIDSPGFAPAR